MVAWSDDLCRCVPVFMALMEQSHERPMDQMRTAVRDIIVERCTTGAGICSHDMATLERHVDLVVKAMEQTRLYEVRKGEWDETPVPPQMFG